jgi:hypothetical protein
MTLLTPQFQRAPDISPETVVIFHGCFEFRAFDFREHSQMLVDVLVVILVLMLIGAFPSWPYSRSWGYYPSGGIGLILMIVVVLLLLHVF